MKKTTTIITSLLIILALEVSGQSVKLHQHIYYDTVKEVKQRIDFSPDTIPCWFVEIQMPKDTASNQPFITLKKGFIIWQVYHKADYGMLTSSGTYGMTLNNLSGPDFYKDNYQFSPSMPGVFLYPDRKTIVKNQVIYSIKR